tara:strand:+ start:1795 stop:2169 length:375 start_codon:yes stop_codon:yes gene_type:complete
MPNLASEDTVDTSSTDGTCIYNAAPIGGDAVSTSVEVGNQPLKIIAGTPFYECDEVTGVKINPLSPLPCQPGTRRITPTVNTTVFIDGKLPAVTGDQAQLVIGGSPRPLTGPFQHASILIGSRL